MRAHFVIFLAAACLWTCPVFADTTWVSGGNVSGVWTSAGSPYMIQDNLHVPSGEVLQISPGVTVFFVSRVIFHISSGARIEAAGTEEDSIYFTTDTLAYPDRWEGIWIHGNADTCRFEYCVVEHATSLGIGAHWFHGPTQLRHSTFRHNSAYSGGAADISSAYVDISHCSFANNFAEWHGGVFNVFEARGIIESCLFENNRAVAGVGGVMEFFQHDTLTIRDCEFRNNRAESGGAVAVQGTNPSFLFEDCGFFANIADSSGGAVYGRNYCGAKFAGCLFQNNQAGSEGGGMRMSHTMTADQCIFIGNSAANGGAIYVAPGSWDDLTVRRCTIVGNSAANLGGGVFVHTETSWMIQACIIASNTGGGGLHLVAGNWPGAITHNLFFNNVGGNFLPEHTILGVLFYTNFNDDSCDWYHNIAFDPQFVDIAAGDFHLLETSPCIDAGPMSSFPLDPDITIADIGAFYFDQTQAVDDSFIVPRSSLIVSSYPNPFNSSTQIRFDLPVASHVTLTVFDLLGREVAILNDEPMTTGTHVRTFDAANLPSGVYLYRLRTAAAAQTH